MIIEVGNVQGITGNISMKDVKVVLKGKTCPWKIVFEVRVRTFDNTPY